MQTNPITNMTHDPDPTGINPRDRRAVQRIPEDDDRGDLVRVAEDITRQEGGGVVRDLTPLGVAAEHDFGVWTLGEGLLGEVGPTIVDVQSAK